MARHFDRERELHSRIAAEIAPALPHIEVIEVELNDPQEKVTVYIDSAEGIGLEHCEAVTHVIRDLVPDHELEVSSPGIERPLRAPDHFRDAIGEQVRVRYTGHHRAIVGELIAVNDSDGITILPEGGEQRVVPFGELVRCKLVVKDPFAAAQSQKKGRA